VSINILNESIEFIRLQILGYCTQSFRKIFTKLSLISDRRDFNEYVWLVVHRIKINQNGPGELIKLNILASDTYKRKV
jgi:hypothetical protein